jgi:GMP synthase-like glutamine amidotransferase
VTSIPEGFKPIATSDSCKYEAFLSDNHRILTVQFHTEYYCHFTKRYEHRSLKFYGKNDLQYFYVPESEAI